MDGSPGLLTTRPLIFNREQIHLFLNAVIQPGGFLQIAVLDVETQLPLAKNICRLPTPSGAPDRGVRLPGQQRRD